MKQHASPRNRIQHVAITPFTVALAVAWSLVFTGSATAQGTGTPLEPCVYYEQESEQARPQVDASCEEAQTWPTLDSTALGDQALATRDAAGDEAAGWSDFDSTAIGDQVIAAREAEVAGVPQFQSTSAL